MKWAEVLPEGGRRELVEATNRIGCEGRSNQRDDGCADWECE